MEANEDVFWGFLDDLWFFYNNKFNTNDMRLSKIDKSANKSENK